MKDIIFGIIGAIILVVGSGYIGNLFGKKKISISGIFSVFDKYGAPAISLIGQIESILPTPAADIARTITAAIITGVETSETYWKDGLLPADQRKALAMQKIDALLADAKIIPTDEINSIISVAIDWAVKLFLPKSNVAQTVVPTVIQA